MRHRTCRDRLSEDRVDDAVRSHLASCGDCSEHAARLHLLTEHAPTIGPAAPTGLAERVVDSVRHAGRTWNDAGAPSAGAPVEAMPLAPAAPAARSGRVALIAGVAAAVALVAGVLVAVTGPGADEPAPATVLAAAAEGLDATFAFDIDATFTVNIDIAALELSGLDLPSASDLFGGQGPGDASDPRGPLIPDVLNCAAPEPDHTGDDGGEPQGRVCEELAQLPEALREQFGEAAEQFGDALGQLEGSLGGVGEALAEGFGPDSLAADITLAGTGQVDRPDRLSVDGTAAGRVEAGLIDIGIDEAVRVIRIGGDVFVSTGPEGWYRLDAATTDVIPEPVLDPDTILDSLGRPDGEVDDVGSETLEGVEVRHVRFTPSPDAFDLPPGSDLTATVDAWIDTQDRLRQVSLTAGGDVDDASATGGFTLDMTLRLRDFGAEVTIVAPPPDQILEGSPLRGIGLPF